MENADDRDEPLEAAKAAMKKQGHRGIVVHIGESDDQHAFIFRLLNRKKMNELTKALAGAKDKKGEPKANLILDILVNAAKFQCFYGAEHIDYVAETYPQALVGDVVDELMDRARGNASIETL